MGVDRAMDDLRARSLVRGNGRLNVKDQAPGLRGLRHQLVGSWRRDSKTQANLP